MKTKIVYVLSSSKYDYFYEQCLMSIMSVRHHNPVAHIELVCDDRTFDTLTGIRSEIKQFVSDIKKVTFESDVDNTIRSRKMKVGLRQLIDGDYLYIDCDTIITGDLSDIDTISYSLAAVLDGHTLLPYHPMREYFAKQNIHLLYPFEDIIQYFSGGVIYSKDDTISHNFYDKWSTNYEKSLALGVKLDEPPLSLTNYQLGFPMRELDGVWNCQIRFGALFLSTAKILHFCSKKNMPVSILGSKEFLAEVKKLGIRTPLLDEYISDWRKAIPKSIVISTGIDACYNTHQSYERDRILYYNKSVKEALYFPKNHNLGELLRAMRNKIVGLLAPQCLSKILYREKFGIALNQCDNNDINVIINKLAFQQDMKTWAILADKIKVRDYVSQCGLEDILLPLYAVWETADDINLQHLPPSFVIKCNHDNGSAIAVNDCYSIDVTFLKKVFAKRLKKTFGIETAEPHYRHIHPLIFVEKFLNNDSDFSDSVVSYKFFSTYGYSDYCQVVYNSNNHKFQRSVIYKVDEWRKCSGFITKSEGTIEIPRPKTLSRMIQIIRILGKDLPFARIDLYEWNNQVYFSEITLMPGAGRITNFSKEFRCILGNKVMLR